MIFGTAATTATQKFRRPDSKSFCRFRDAAVPRNRQTGSTENSRSAHLYKLHFVSFVVRSATLKKTEKRRELSGQDVCLSDRARTLKQTPPGQGYAPTP